MTDYERGFADCREAVRTAADTAILNAQVALDLALLGNDTSKCGGAVKGLQKLYAEIANLQPSAPSISAERVRDIAINALTINFHIGTLEIEQAIKDALRESGVRVEGE